MADEAASEPKRSRPGRQSAVAVVAGPAPPALAAAKSPVTDPAFVGSAAKKLDSAVSAARLGASAGSAEASESLPDARHQPRRYERPLRRLLAWSQVAPHGDPCSGRSCSPGPGHSQ